MKKANIRIQRTNILKNFLLSTLSLAIVLITMLGCEGLEGPEGPEGSDGQVGPAGDDGSVILAGTGAPSSDTGVDGDYYLDQSTGELYGPKINNGWGTPISLQGPDGPAGEDGSQIYSGDDSPDASLGVVGDYYLDVVNFDLYGPKTDSGWETPMNLKGTANVIYSSWTTIDGVVRDTIVDASNMRIGEINAPQVSQEMLDQGVINVYMKFSDDVYPLPFTGYAGGKTNTIDFLPSLNLIFISRFSHDNSGSSGLSNILQFRYVLIPGGVAAESRNMSRSEIRNMPYDEVQKRFGIQD